MGIESDIGILFVMILLSGFFSGAETALFSLNKLKVEHLVEKKKKGIDTVKFLKDRPHDLLVTLLIGNNIVNVGASAFATSVAIGLFQNNAIGITTGVMTFLILTFGEIIPKNFALHHNVLFSIVVAKPIYILSIIFYPIVKFYGFFNRRFENEGDPMVTEEEIQTYINIGQKTGEIKKEETADVVVGTPGRLIDHLQRGTMDLRYVKILVLDEADRMLDMGFIDDVNKIVSQCPKKRQTMLFSATLTVEVLRLSDNYLNDPTEISCESRVDPSKLKQVYYDVPDNMKFSLLVHLVKKDKSGLVMVFCNTQRNTDFVARNLEALGVNALAIHGGHSQDKRKQTMKKFHSKDIDVMVCTDVAARGLDIKDVSHVYNYDLPKEPEQYIHRIGRTARAGEEGKAVNILASRDYDLFNKLMRDETLNIERRDLPEFGRVYIRVREDPRDSKRSYGRDSRGPPRRSSGGRGASRDSRRSSYGRDSRGGRDSRRTSGRRDSRDSRSRFGSRKPSRSRNSNSRGGYARD